MASTQHSRPHMFIADAIGAWLMSVEALTPFTIDDAIPKCLSYWRQALAGGTADFVLDMFLGSLMVNDFKVGTPVPLDSFTWASVQLDTVVTLDGIALAIGDSIGSTSRLSDLIEAPTVLFALVHLSTERTEPWISQHPKVRMVPTETIALTLAQLTIMELFDKSDWDLLSSQQDKQLLNHALDRWSIHWNHAITLYDRWTNLRGQI